MGLDPHLSFVLSATKAQPGNCFSLSLLNYTPSILLLRGTSWPQSSTMRLTLGLLTLVSLIGSAFSAIGDRCSVAQGDGHCDKIAACRDVGE